MRDTRADPHPVVHPRGNRHRLAIPVAATAVVVAFVLAGVLVGRRETTTPRGEGASVAGIVLPALDGGGTVDLGSLRGRPLVVNYFASWCPFCIAEMPGFQRVHVAVGRRVTFVGIALQDDASAARSLARQTGIDYTLAADDDASSFGRVGGRGMPVTLFVDAQGRIIERFTGPLSHDALRDRIRRHFSV